MTHLPETHTLDLVRSDGWLTVWFNQPEMRNALTTEMVGELRAVLQAVRDDREVRGITLRGRGGVFCAGGDLKAFKMDLQASGAHEDVLKMSRVGGALFQAVATMPQITVAVLEGAAMAGGIGLASAADIVVCEKTCRFALSETKIGLSPAQIAPYLIRKLGFNTARRLMLTAASFTGAEAYTFGLADYLCDGAEALAEVEAKVRRQTLKCAPGAIADTKALIDMLAGSIDDTSINIAAENFAGRLLSDEGREGVASFLEKRAPNWAIKED